MSAQFKQPDEARAMLASKLAELRELGHDRLRAMITTKWSLFGGRVQLGGDESELVEVHGSSGVLYQLETDVFWNDQKRGDIQVIVTLFEERYADRTMSDSFILGSDGFISA